MATATTKKRTSFKPGIIRAKSTSARIEAMRENLGGRPKGLTKVRSADDLYALIIEYFEKCSMTKELPNKAGLCWYLGISRDTLNSYEKMHENGFSDATKRAYERIQDIWVQKLGTNAPVGSIFYLKNAFRTDFADRFESDISSNGAPVQFVLAPEIAAKHGIAK